MKQRKIALIATAALAVATAGCASAQASGRHLAACRNGYVALTFDDGPDPVSTPRLLTALRDTGLRATFFDIGQYVQTHPALVRRTVAYGNAVEDHTWDHRSLTGATTNSAALSETQVASELGRAKQAIVSVTGRQPAFFRSPYGDSNAAVQQAAGRLGMTEVGWTVDSRDYKGIPTNRIVANVLSVQPGGVVVMHDTAHTANTIAAIPAIAAGIHSRGLCAGRLAPSTPGTSGWEHGVFHARPVDWPPQTREQQ